MPEPDAGTGKMPALQSSRRYLDQRTGAVAQ